MPARILIVEDNADNRELMRYLLDTHKMTVICAETGPEGLRMAQTEKPDLILCDIQLPGMDGLELAGTLRADPTLRAIPLVAVTALAMVGDRDRILRAGFDGYIDKPIAPELFVGQVADYLPGSVRVVSASAQAPSDVSAAEPAPNTGRAPSGLSRRILVMDDRTENLDLMRILLESAGYVIDTVTTYSEAIGRLRTERPDLILSDVNMPQDDGFDLLAEIRRDPSLCHLKFAFVSASDWTDDLRERAFRLGANRFFVRSADYETLLSDIDQCLK